MLEEMENAYLRFIKNFESRTPEFILVICVCRILWYRHKTVFLLILIFSHHGNIKFCAKTGDNKYKIMQMIVESSVVCQSRILICASGFFSLCFRGWTAVFFMFCKVQKLVGCVTLCGEMSGAWINVLNIRYSALIKKKNEFKIIVSWWFFFIAGKKWQHFCKGLSGI